MNISRKAILILSITTLMIITVLGAYHTEIRRLYHVLSLFDEDRIVENFRTMGEHFPRTELRASQHSYMYERGKTKILPEIFPYQGAEVSTNFFLAGSKTTGLLIIKDDSVVYERYFLGNTQDTKNISWSMAKSFVATLVGIAVDQGFIKELTDPVDKYVPELKGTAYEGVQIKNVLQMSSGVKFNEDYDDFGSDINRWGRAFALGKSQDDFAGTLIKEREQGVYNKYVSIDTHVLSMVLSRATGQSLTEYMQAKLWDPLGMEYDGYWNADDYGTEVALCGLNATLRDFGKLGSLYLNKGRWRGEQLVSEDWINDSVTPNAPHLLPGKDNPNSAHELGYGYQWWVPEGEDGEFLAQGVYNQNIYVNPTKNIVIVKLSANDKFNDDSYIPTQWQAALAFYRTVSNSY